MSVIFYH
jgi:hypothetical protein